MAFNILEDKRLWCGGGRLWLSFPCSGLYKKSGKLVFLGLDNAGKTTLLHMLKDDRLGQHVPTLHPSEPKLHTCAHRRVPKAKQTQAYQVERCSASLFSLQPRKSSKSPAWPSPPLILEATHKVGPLTSPTPCASVTSAVGLISVFAARRVWKNYLPAINGVVFLVDCADFQRLGESKAELDVSVSSLQPRVPATFGCVL